MTAEYALEPGQPAIRKMPAVDPVVQQAAQELVTDPDGYFARHGEAARQEARESLERQQAAAADALASQARQQRRERLARFVGLVLRWRKT